MTKESLLNGSINKSLHYLSFDCGCVGIHKVTVKNGQFIRANNYWYWRSLELDKLKIKPFINDPSFLCCTHIYCTFIQKNNILGYSIISHKIKEDYYKT